MWRHHLGVGVSGRVRHRLALTAVAFLVTALASERIGMGLFARREVAVPPNVVTDRPLTGRALLIVVDGLRADVAFEQLPIAQELAGRGASGVALADDPTMTGASVRVLGTGEPAELADLVRNDELRPVQHDHLFSALAERGLRTAAIGDHSWTDLFGRSIAIDRTHPAMPGLAAALRPVYVPDEVFFANARELLAVRSAELTVVHFIGTDAASHTFGPLSPQYAKRLAVLDRQIRDLIAACGDGCTIVLTSDHGANDRGAHGLAEDIARRTPLVLAGPGIRAGVHLRARQIDVAPTLAALLGASPPAHAHGRVLVEAFAGDTAAIAQHDAERLARLHRAIGPPHRPTLTLVLWSAGLLAIAFVLVGVRWSRWWLLVPAAEAVFVLWRLYAEQVRRAVVVLDLRWVKLALLGALAAVVLARLRKIEWGRIDVWPVALLVLGLALRLTAETSLAMRACLAGGVVGVLAAPAERRGWMAAALLAVMCEPAQLPGLAGVLALGAVARTARTPLRAAMLIVAARLALVLVCERGFNYGNIEWAVGRLGNAGNDKLLAHGLVVLKFALPAVAIAGIARASDRTQAWCLALLLIAQAHCLLSLALTIGQYHTLYVDLTYALFASALAGSFAISRLLIGGAKHTSA